MVGSIYYILMPYSDFTKAKGRPVLVLQEIDKNDFLILPLTSNLQREGSRFIATLKEESFLKVKKRLCKKLEC